jgi:hypothetical protein
MSAAVRTCSPSPCGLSIMADASDRPSLLTVRPLRAPTCVKIRTVTVRLDCLRTDFPMSAASAGSTAAIWTMSADRAASDNSLLPMTAKDLDIRLISSMYETGPCRHARIPRLEARLTRSGVGSMECIPTHLIVCRCHPVLSTDRLQLCGVQGPTRNDSNGC